MSQAKKANFNSSRSKNSKKSSRNTSAVTRKALIESDESDSSDSILSDDVDRWKESKPVDLSADYHSIQKLVKYVKAGNTTATMISLCCLKDFDLSIFINQMVRFIQKKKLFIHFFKQLFIINYITNLYSKRRLYKILVVLKLW